MLREWEAFEVSDTASKTTERYNNLEIAYRVKCAIPLKSCGHSSGYYTRKMKIYIYT